MSRELTPEEALQLIPELQGQDCVVRPMTDGLTNRNFRVSVDDRVFILRLDAPHTADFGLDRTNEMRVHKSAHAAGLAPRVHFVDAGRGILLREFIDGKEWRGEDLQADETLVSLAKLLRRVHSLPLCGTRLDPPAKAREYAALLANRPGLAAFAETCVERIATVAAPARLVCCHGDVIAENVVETESLMLIDWEYACDYDPLFDLASLICFHNLDERQSDMLLAEYLGEPAGAARERIKEQVLVYDALQWLWFACRHRVSPDAQLARYLEKLQQRII